MKQRSRLMLIEVRTDGNIQGSEQLSDHVKAVVPRWTALGIVSDELMCTSATKSATRSAMTTSAA
jgi:hypothetical protein